MKLTVYLCAKYGLDKTAVLRHSELGGQSCPKYFAEQKEITILPERFFLVCAKVLLLLLIISGALLVALESVSSMRLRIRLRWLKTKPRRTQSAFYYRPERRDHTVHSFVGGSVRVGSKERGHHIHYLLSSGEL